MECSNKDSLKHLTELASHLLRLPDCTQSGRMLNEKIVCVKFIIYFLSKKMNYPQRMPHRHVGGAGLHRCTPKTNVSPLLSWLMQRRRKRRCCNYIKRILEKKTAD